MKDKQPEPEDIVKLKPINGVRPGVWLTILYSVMLLVILFFLLIFPGLVNPGAVLIPTTEPAGAGIRVDGVYMGTSGEKIFLPKGTYTLTVVMPGFESQSAVHEIPGRVFGSLFSPRRYRVEFTLKADNPAAAFALSAADFAAWSFGGEPTVSWQIPLSLSEGAYRIGPERDPAAAEILPAAARFTNTRAGLRDLVRAKFLLDNGGLSPSPSGLTGSVFDILVFLSENPLSVKWLADLLPPESAAILKNSDWYINNLSAFIPPSLPFQAAGRQVEFNGLIFTDIVVPENSDIKSFMLNTRPVSVALYETFLEENPSWRSYDFFREAVSGETEDYATGVSWYAAEAFCHWLTARLPLFMAEMEIRLPWEKELDYARNAGMPDLKINTGEWAADFFAPISFINAQQWAVNAVGSPERTIRLFDSSRTSLPPEMASPAVTFRVVLAEKR